MITTREINVILTKGKLKLRQSTTKNVDASIRVEPPKGKIKPRGVSTTTQADVADIVEKKRRDDIMAEQKLAIKDEKKITMVEKEKGPKLIEPSRELMAELTKKSWNKMNAKERKEYQLEKAKKKKEGLK